MPKRRARQVRAPRPPQRQQQQQDQGDDDPFTHSPLMPDAGSDHAYTAVSREDPEEGFLGKLPPQATEADLRKKWGGGTFDLSARNSGGKHIKGGHSTVTISGDPIFQSRIAEAKWRRAQGANGGGGGEEPAARAPASNDPKPLGVGELMMLMDKQAEKARGDGREMFLMMTQMTNAAHDRQLELLRADQERRATEASERDERRKREDIAERERNREFMATMLQLVKAEGAGGKAADGGGQLETFMRAVEFVRELTPGNNGEPPDVFQTLMEKGPGIIGELRKTAVAAIREGRGQAPEGDEDGGEAAGAGAAEPAITIKGQLAQKLRALAAHLKRQGKDPEKALDQIATMYLRQQTTPRAAAAQPAAAAPPSNGASSPAATTAARPLKPELVRKVAARRAAPDRRRPAKRAAAARRRGPVSAAPVKGGAA